MPLFLYGNATQTFPYELRKHQRSQFLHGSADAAQESDRRGINVYDSIYEVNPWFWQFGRGKPCLRGLSVTENEDRRIAVRQNGAKRSHATHTKRKLKAAAKCGGE